MRKIFLALAAAVMFAAVIPSVSAAVRVTYYPLTVVAEADTVYINWDDGAGGVPAFTGTVLYGISAGNYSGTIPESAAGSLSFIPANLTAPGMTGGVYYFRVSNNADGSWSNEYRLFIAKAGGVGVSYMKLSPNPFSPDLGGLNISYTPESDSKTSVKVSIKVYTMDGKFITTVVNGGIRTVGTVSTDTWDGRDALGYMSKNGRYIIQLEVQDSTGKKQYLDTVVMVK